MTKPPFLRKNGGLKAPSLRIALPVLHKEFDRGPFLSVDLNLGKRGNTDEVDTIRRDEAAGNRNRFDCLVDGPGTDRLKLSGAFLTDDCC